jgi:hypothetical protein
MRHTGRLINTVITKPRGKLIRVMVLEDRLHKWLEDNVKGSVLSAVAHPQSNSFLVLERTSPTKSQEMSLKLHICLWYHYLSDESGKQESSVDLKISFIKGKTEQIAFDNLDKLQASLTFSKNGDLLFCIIDHKVFGRFFLIFSDSLRYQSCIVRLRSQKITDPHILSTFASHPYHQNRPL